MLTHSGMPSHSETTQCACWLYVGNHKMKTLLTILLGLISLQLFSQRIICENIGEFKLHEIYKELTIENKYNVTESKCFGERLAKHDSLLGFKRILLYHGPFTTGCQKCLYHKCGFETYDFAPNDLIFDNTEAFIQAYNEIMESMLSSNQRKEIDDFNYTTDKIFTSFLTTKNNYDLEFINDSTLIFKMHSDTLEYLFKKDVDLITVSIGDSINDTNPSKLSYSELKTVGLKVKTGNETKLKLFVCYDFGSIPNKYDICWCELLENKYRMIIPLKLK